MPNEMDKVESRKGFLSDIIDLAILRHGRLDKFIFALFYYFYN